MPRYDLTDFLEDGAIVLEGVRGEKFPNGKDYTFPSPSADVGLYLSHIATLGFTAMAGGDVDPASDTKDLVLNDDEEKDLYRQVMGPTLDELKADKVPWTSVQAIFRLLFAKHALGQDIEDTLASSGEAQARGNRATRRSAKKTAGSRPRRRASGAATESAKATTSTTSGSSTSPTVPAEAAAAV